MVLNLRTCHAPWIVTQCICPGQWGRTLCDNRMKKKRDNRHNNKYEGNLMYCSYEIDSSSHGVNVLRKDTLVGPLRATLLRVAVCVLCVCQWRRAFNEKYCVTTHLTTAQETVLHRCYKIDSSSPLGVSL